MAWSLSAGGLFKKSSSPLLSPKAGRLVTPHCCCSVQKEDRHQTSAMEVRCLYYKYLATVLSPVRVAICISKYAQIHSEGIAPRPHIAVPSACIAPISVGILHLQHAPRNRTARTEQENRYKQKSCSEKS